MSFGLRRQACPRIVRSNLVSLPSFQLYDDSAIIPFGRRFSKALTSKRLDRPASTDLPISSAKHDRLIALPITASTTMTMTMAAPPPRILPNVSDLINYDKAVAGHDGVLSDASGELFIKPCTPAEASFYTTSLVDHPEFAEFMPTFLGTLQLSGNDPSTIEEQGAALLAQHQSQDPSVPEKIPQAQVPRSGKITTDQAIVLENAAFGFKQPNILDVKLGVRLWADDAREEKKMRFNKITEQTTHKRLGFRIAGMRVWQGPDVQQNGVIDKDGYRIFDKDYGKVDVNDENIHDAFRKFFFTKSAGIDEELGQLVVQAFLADLESIQQVLENQESRMYSASLLFVFEGDGEALQFAMEEASKPLQEEAAEGEDEDEDFEDTSPKIYSLKVIDFAHAEWLPGMGPDENSLQGIRNVVKVLKDLGRP